MTVTNDGDRCCLLFGCKISQCVRVFYILILINASYGDGKCRVRFFSILKINFVLTTRLKKGIENGQITQQKLQTHRPKAINHLKK